MRKGGSKESGHLLSVPFTSPISTINSTGDKILVGTWDGYFYQVCLNRREVVRVPIEPSYPVRYIGVLRGDAARGSDWSAEAQTSYELILGGVYRARVRENSRTNSPLEPLEELEMSSDTHYQIVETRSSLASVCSAAEGDKSVDGEGSKSPLFLFSSTINSYFGFCGEGGRIEISLANFYIPDREFVILDCDFQNGHLLVVERSPERLDYYTLCSLQVLELPRSQKIGRKEDGEETDPAQVANLADLPPKYILNFPFKHPLLITPTVRADLTLSSSAERSNHRCDVHVYKYTYPTMFSMSDFKDERLSVFKSMHNLCDAKFWGRDSLVFVVSSHTIIGVYLAFFRENEFTTSTKANSTLCVKSPDRNITSISTSNHTYLVAVTEKNRIFLANRRGEIVFSVNHITPDKCNFRWVWPVHVLIMHDTGTVIFSTTNGLYYVKCDLLDKRKALRSPDLHFQIDLPS